MLKKVIKYTDFDGNEKTETFYFNLTKVEALEMDLNVDGGLGKYIENVVANEDKKNIYDVFKNFVLNSYGERTPDGKFIKSKELSEAFSHTEAYSELVFELASDADAATNFINGLVHGIKLNN